METDYKNTLLSAGERAEKSIAWYCAIKEIEVFVPTDKIRISTGVDVVLNGVPTDVKDTRKISLGNFRTQYYKDERTRNIFMNRMPFNKNCEAIDYLIIEVNPIELSNTIKYHGPIIPYLLNNYFLGEDEMVEAYSLLKQFHFRSPQSFGVNNSDELFEILKQKFSKLVKENICVDYSIIKPKYEKVTGEYQFYMIKNEDLPWLNNKKTWYTEHSKKGG